MSALTAPRDPLVERALTDARVWCAGKIIDERPALAHAIQVAATIGRHAPQAPREVIAAALLHDAPDFMPDGLYPDLRARYGPEVPRIIQALHEEHTALDWPDPVIVSGDRVVLLASTADKIVAFRSLLRRANARSNTRAFFAARPALVDLLPHFRAFHAAGVGRVPATMSDYLGAVLAQVTRAAIR